MSTATTVFTSCDQLRSQSAVQAVKAQNEGFAGFTGRPGRMPGLCQGDLPSFELLKRPDASQRLAGYAVPEHEALIARDQ